MAKLAVCVSALLLLVALGETSPPTPCCTENTNKPIPLVKLRNYALQNDRGICNINSTIFFTEKNRLICANPEMRWVHNAVDYLKKKQSRTEN